MAVDSYVNQYDKSQRYTKLMARPGDIRGLLTKDGWLIFRVMLAELTYYDPYSFSTQFEATGTADSGQVELRIRDSADREILYHERKGEMWEVFQGYSQPYPKIFMKYNGERFGRLQKDLGDPNVQSTTGSVFGFQFKGADSLYGKETGFSRFLVPPYQYVQFDILNPSGKAFYLDTRYVINKMKVEPLNPKDPDDVKLMVEILRGRIRKDVWLWGGGLEKYPWSHANIIDIVGVEPATWNGKTLKVGGTAVYGGDM